MSFTLAVCLLPSCFCLGAAFGCALCIAVGVIFHRSYEFGRFSAMCVFLSIVVILSAAALVFVNGGFVSIRFTAGIIWVCVGSFAAGILAALSLRLFFPCLFLVYLVCSAVTAVFLYNRFGRQPAAVSIIIDRGKVFVGDTAFTTVSGEFPQVLFIDTYELPPELVLAVPRKWYSILGVGTVAEAGTYASVSAVQGKSAADRYLRFLLKYRTLYTIDVPQDSTVPRQYTLRAVHDRNNPWKVETSEPQF